MKRNAYKLKRIGYIKKYPGHISKKKTTQEKNGQMIRQFIREELQMTNI